MNGVAEMEVRSENSSLTALDQTLEALGKATEDDEIATLIFMACELYADGNCVCEEKETIFGEGSAQVKACSWDVNRHREKMIDVFKGMVAKIRAG